MNIDALSSGTGRERRAVSMNPSTFIDLDLHVADLDPDAVEFDPRKFAAGINIMEELRTYQDDEPEDDVEPTRLNIWAFPDALFNPIDAISQDVAGYKEPSRSAVCAAALGYGIPVLFNHPAIAATISVRSEFNRRKSRLDEAADDLLDKQIRKAEVGFSLPDSDTVRFNPYVPVGVKKQVSALKVKTGMSESSLAVIAAVISLCHQRQTRSEKAEKWASSVASFLRTMAFRAKLIYAGIELFDPEAEEDVTQDRKRLNARRARMVERETVLREREFKLDQRELELDIREQTQ